MDKLIQAIQNMIEVEKAIDLCPDCWVGGFCDKHQEAFWGCWREVKRQILEKSSEQDETWFCSTCKHDENHGELCESCGEPRHQP